LSLSGYLSSDTDRITFTLLFEAVDGHWKFAGVSLASAREPLPAKAAGPLRP
jgi:hypothetical protein